VEHVNGLYAVICVESKYLQFNADPHVFLGIVGTRFYFFVSLFFFIFQINQGTAKSKKMMA